MINDRYVLPPLSVRNVEEETTFGIHRPSSTDANAFDGFVPGEFPSQFHDAVKIVSGTRLQRLETLASLPAPGAPRAHGDLAASDVDAENQTVAILSHGHMERLRLDFLCIHAAAEELEAQFQSFLERHLRLPLEDTASPGNIRPTHLGIVLGQVLEDDF